MSPKRGIASPKPPLANLLLNAPIFCTMRVRRCRPHCTRPPITGHIRPVRSNQFINTERERRKTLPKADHTTRPRAIASLALSCSVYASCQAFNKVKPCAPQRSIRKVKSADRTGKSKRQFGIKTTPNLDPPQIWTSLANEV